MKKILLLLIIVFLFGFSISLLVPGAYSQSDNSDQTEEPGTGEEDNIVYN